MRFVVCTYKLEILLACWLALVQELTRAYTFESLSQACGQGFATRTKIELSSRGPGSAVSLVFDKVVRGAAPVTCGVDVHAPESQVLSVQLLRAAPTPIVNSESHHSPCPLAVYFVTRIGSPKRHVRSVDLCDEAAVNNFSALIPLQNITLVWMPPYGNFSHRLQASEVIVTALEYGSRACDTSDTSRAIFPCVSHALCVSVDFVCDGRPNCPHGDDEDPQLCVLHPSNKSLENPRQPKPTSNVLVNTSTAVDSSTSLAAALSKYGPWGFIMLGILTCGGIVVCCGVLGWCCCSTPKTSSVPRPSTPSVFVIGSSVQPEVTPPPSYDDLDQPPAYNTLFPSLTSKHTNISAALY